MGRVDELACRESCPTGSDGLNGFRIPGFQDCVVHSALSMAKMKLLAVLVDVLAPASWFRRTSCGSMDADLSEVFVGIVVEEDAGLLQRDDAGRQLAGQSDRPHVRTFRPRLQEKQLCQVRRSMAPTSRSCADHVAMHGSTKRWPPRQCCRRHALREGLSASLGPSRAPTTARGRYTDDGEA